MAQERIMHRINSKMAHKSYQLGQQLSLRWSTGVGPRIGCVRDYLPKLQFRLLEDSGFEIVPSTFAFGGGFGL